jgi:predicted secreted protein
MALTELVTWWVVPVLPLAVAGMVKLNDVIAGTMERHG